MRTILCKMLSVVGWTIFFTPLYAVSAQRFVPDQLLKQNLAQTQTNMIKLLTTVSKTKKTGESLTLYGWKAFKTVNSSVGFHDKTGLIAAYDEAKDRYVVMQVFEFICPSDIATNSRLSGEKPSFDAVATAVLHNGKTSISKGTRVVNFEPEGAVDKLLCTTKSP